MGTYNISMEELKDKCIVFIGEIEGDFSLSKLLKAIKRAWWHYEYYDKKRLKTLNRK